MSVTSEYIYSYQREKDQGKRGFPGPAGSSGFSNATQILTALLTVDGTGSGVDADLLDGQHGSYYAAVSALSGYAPLANPAFTGNASFTGANVILTLAGTDESNLLYKTGSTNKMDVYVASDGSYRVYSYQKTGGAADILMLDRDGYMGLGFTGALAKLAINGGLHVGGESDPGDNNILADGSITGLSHKTANWSTEEDASGNELHKYQGVLKWYVTPAGYIRSADDMEPKASMTI